MTSPGVQETTASQRGSRRAAPAAAVEALKLRLGGQSRRDGYLFVPLVALLALYGVAALVTGAVVSKGNDKNAFMDSGHGSPLRPWFGSCGAAFALALLFYLWSLRRASERHTRLELAELEARTEDEVRGAMGSTDLDTLLDINRALLTQYHRLSTGQARTAFRMAQAVMATAAVLLLLGCALAVAAHDTATGVTIASLSGLASAVGGYISTTLLRTYQISVRQAEVYFREPVAASYLLAAERIARGLDTSHQQPVLGRVVDGFLQAATGVTHSTAVPADASPVADGG